jgi:hypothetical protein
MWPVRTKRIVIILGMHRSGTSALARTLNLLGVDLGGPLLLPYPTTNERGFWEHRRVLDFDERLLATIGSSWDDVDPLPRDWHSSARLLPYRAELRALLGHEFAEGSLIGVKDPRISRLLPLWVGVLDQLGWEPHLVLMVRHPVEVARSLAKRDGFHAVKTFRLWLAHNLEAERASRGYRRVIVTFDQLLDDWRATADRIAAGLEIDWPNEVADAGAEIERFLAPALRHHRVSDDERSLPARSRLATVYDHLCKAAELGTPPALEEVEPGTDLRETVELWRHALRTKLDALRVLAFRHRRS